MVAQDPRSLYEDACAEIGQTRMFEGSKRVDILKSVGGLSSQQAANANESMTQVLKSTNSLLAGPKLLAENGIGDVRSNLADQITEACADELVVLQDNACTLSVLAAVELDANPDEASIAQAELIMRMMRIVMKVCEGDITDSVLSED